MQVYCKGPVTDLRNRICSKIHKYRYFFAESDKDMVNFSENNKNINIWFLDDECQPVWDICHYKRLFPSINMISMFRQDFAQLSIFSGLSDEQISQLSPYLVECHFKKDQVIFEQGQRADHLYILLSGEVTVNYKPYDGPPLTVARIEPGGVFGWSAALGRDVYTSGALAVQDSLAYRIRGDNLAVLCDEHHDTGMILLDRLAGVIAERLRGTHTQVLGILSQGIDVDGNCLRRMNKNE